MRKTKDEGGKDSNEEGGGSDSEGGGGRQGRLMKLRIRAARLRLMIRLDANDKCRVISNEQI
jgi:hypothetical protein